MAVSAVVLKDTDYETVVKVTTTGTNSNASIVDASSLQGADTDPRLAIVACQWTTGSQNILFDASSNDVALSLNGNGAYNTCLLYTSPSPRDGLLSRMPSSA